MKIRDRLEILRAVAPKKDTATGQLYRVAEDRGRVFTHIRMYMIMKSSRNSYHVHEMIFKKNDGKRAQEWRAWLDKHLRDILANSVLPGINVTDESQIWSVEKLIGWVGEKTKGRKRDKRKSRNSKVAKKRHTAKRQGARGGKNHLRRRHGNRKGKT